MKIEDAEICAALKKNKCTRGDYAIISQLLEIGEIGYRFAEIPGERPTFTIETGFLSIPRAGLLVAAFVRVLDARDLLSRVYLTIEGELCDIPRYTPAGVPK